MLHERRLSPLLNPKPRGRRRSRHVDFRAAIRIFRRARAVLRVSGEVASGGELASDGGASTVECLR